MFYKAIRLSFQSSTRTWSIDIKDNIKNLTDRSNMWSKFMCLLKPVHSDYETEEEKVASLPKGNDSFPGLNLSFLELRMFGC